jgi:hypothetical protein
MSPKELLTKYAELKLQEKVVKNGLNFYKEEVEKVVAEHFKTHSKEEPLGIEGQGYFTIVPRKTWTFSQAVTDLEVALEELKAKEMAEGLASYTEETSVRFNPIK